MPAFFKNTNKGNDDYETPVEYWKVIEPYIPTTTIINDPFYMNGNAEKKWKELGRDIIHNDEDFFTLEKDDKDITYVSNPPFTKFKEVLKHLFYLDKPFMMLVPIQKVANLKIQKILKDKENIQIIISKIYKGFIDEDGEQTRCPAQYFCYLCSKMNLEKDLIFP
tara:strand:+ start:97 stop:591 length:495 start_codon:yes stop_codon:yes gene_type:complete